MLCVPLAVAVLNLARAKDHPKNQQREKQPPSGVKSSWGVAVNQLVGSWPTSYGQQNCHHPRSGPSGHSIQEEKTKSPTSAKSQVQRPRGSHTGWLGDLWWMEPWPGHAQSLVKPLLCPSSGLPAAGAWWLLGHVDPSAELMADGGEAIT